jgi:hypothetical protein
MHLPVTHAPARPGLKLWLAFLALGVGGYLLAAPYFAQALSGLAEKAGKPVGLLFAGQALNVVVLTAVTGWVGIWASRRNQLDAPLLRARLEGRPIARALLALLPRGVLWGTVGALLVLALNVACAGLLPEGLRLHGAQLGPGARALAVVVGASSAFYGGFVEELLVRWGLLSLLLVLAMKVLPRRPAFFVANGVSAVLFGAGHLPLALQLGATGGALVYVVVANMLVGLLCGWLFFRHGLEQAIITHAWADVAVHALPLLFLR